MRNGILIVGERERDRKGVEERERKNIHFTVVAPHLSQLCDGESWPWTLFTLTRVFMRVVNEEINLP